MIKPPNIRKEFHISPAKNDHSPSHACKLASHTSGHFHCYFIIHSRSKVFPLIKSLTIVVYSSLVTNDIITA